MKCVCLPSRSRCYQGRVVEWLRKPGDKVSKGEPLVLVESDKATNELVAPQEGILSRIVVDAGQEVDVDALLAVIDAVDQEVTGASPESKVPAHAIPVEAVAPRAPAAMGAEARLSGRQAAGPRAGR